MRRALNENPRVQLIVIGGMLLLGVVLLFTTVLKKDEPITADPATSASPSASAAAESTEVPATAPPVPSAEAVDPAAASPAPTAEASAAGADGLLPTKGLPKNVLIAYAKGDAIALLVIDPDATSDQQVRRYTEELSARNDVEVLIVDVEDVAKYSRITSGVAVSRTPALVVIRPRKLTDDVPTATVSYGFRGPRSVEQALDDSLYQGKSIPAYP